MDRQVGPGGAGVGQEEHLELQEERTGGVRPGRSQLRTGGAGAYGPGGVGPGGVGPYGPGGVVQVEPTLWTRRTRW
ncbi:hypothetical protein AVEN_97141-1 [Araneus ventricosus]|uniref:Uncharacterized protein n=1 Tax=Araneus ventricosus TaxID=182803 RepID=A0A4Y2DCT8_ARAVE|nr:hypothetical protein AVEN_97141-1 [Araneus ventricosus]